VTISNFSSPVGSIARGGEKFASLPHFSRYCITKDELKEKGEYAFDRFCLPVEEEFKLVLPSRSEVPPVKEKKGGGRGSGKKRALAQTTPEAPVKMENVVVTTEEVASEAVDVAMPPLPLTSEVAAEQQEKAQVVEEVSKPESSDPVKQEEQQEKGKEEEQEQEGDKEKPNPEVVEGEKN